MGLLPYFKMVSIKFSIRFLLTEPTGYDFNLIALNSRRHVPYIQHPASSLGKNAHFSLYFLLSNYDASFV